MSRFSVSSRSVKTEPDEEYRLNKEHQSYYKEPQQYYVQQYYTEVQYIAIPNINNQDINRTPSPIFEKAGHINVLGIKFKFTVYLLPANSTFLHYSVTYKRIGKPYYKLKAEFDHRPTYEEIEYSLTQILNSDPERYLTGNESHIDKRKRKKNRRR